MWHEGGEMSFLKHKLTVQQVHTDSGGENEIA